MSGFFGSALIHFILVEMRALFIYYLGAKQIILHVGFQAYLPVAMERSGSIDNMGNTSLQHLVSEIGNGVLRASAVPSFYYADANGVVSYPDGTNALWIVHYIVVAITATFIIGMLGALVFAGTWRFDRGDYLAFTWEVERSMLYKCMSRVLLAATLVLFAGAFCYIHWNPRIRKLYSGLDFLKGNMLSFAALLCSTYAITVPAEKPQFNYACSEFAEVRFNRKLIDCFVQTNDCFAMKLSNAILGSVRHDDGELIGVLHDPGLTSILIQPVKAQFRRQDPILCEVVHFEPIIVSGQDCSDTDESA